MFTSYLATNLKFKTDIKVPGGYQPQGNSIDAYTTSSENLLSNVLGVLTIVAGLSFMIYFLIGGIQWITAGGDKGKIEEAKAVMTNGAIGLIIVVVSYSITWIVSKALGINILEPSTIINSKVFKF